MASAAFHGFLKAREHSQTLRAARPAGKKRNGSRVEQAYIYQAALAATVASWDAYVNQLVMAFIRSTYSSHDRAFTGFHGLLEKAAETQLRRFNVPNSDNVRNLLVATTGFDPWPSWNWRAGRLSSIDVRERLNEVLKVRHSFAHGFSMPRFSWNQAPDGTPRIDARILTWIDRFFLFLAKSTDQGVEGHIKTAYGLDPGW